MVKSAQMNILLTNNCNRKCPYCFAQERISYRASEKGEDLPRKAPRQISREDYRTVLDFVIGSGEKRVSLLGGEPSLHNEFIDLLEETRALGLETTIFTNGIWGEKIVAAFSSRIKKGDPHVNLIVNVNHPDDTPSKEKEAQEFLLSILGEFCALSFNIYREDFAPLFLIDIIERFRCKRHIRLGVAAPLAHHVNQHVDIVRYKHLSPTIMQLAKRCDGKNINIGFDCGFVLCMFSAEELGKLHLANVRCRFDCGPALDVGTDLSVWPCFPLSTFSKGVHLRDFDDVKGILKYFHKQFNRLYWTGAVSDCIECRYRKRKQCAGGCAAHVFRKVNP